MPDEPKPRYLTIGGRRMTLEEAKNLRVMYHSSAFAMHSEIVEGMRVEVCNRTMSTPKQDECAIREAIGAAIHTLEIQAIPREVEKWIAETERSVDNDSQE